MTKKVEKYKKKYRYIKKYMEIANIWSELSYANNKKVGCIIVKNNMIISDGYNGTPSNFENECEDSNGVTKWYVMHAEANAILKLAKSTKSGEHADLYTTLSPCKECAKLIIQCGIKKVYYKELYKDLSGINILNKVNIETIKI
jgi:dCMP deaminase